MKVRSVGRVGCAGRKNIWVWSATAPKSGHRAFATDLLVGFSLNAEELDSENIRLLVGMHKLKNLSCE